LKVIPRAGSIPAARILLLETNPLPNSSAMQSDSPPVPLRLWAGLAVAVLLDAPLQLMWKALMSKYASPLRGPVAGWNALGLLHQSRWFLHQTRTWGLLALFVCQFFNWMWVLGNADLSYAQPFTALSYVVVSSCAAVYFHEHLSPLRIAGIGMILIGVMLVGSSPHRTTPVGHSGEVA
jgi:drug/metabolite transporter (DMT)-like permease